MFYNPEPLRFFLSHVKLAKKGENSSFFLPILLRKTRQRRDVTYDVIDELRCLGLSKCFLVLCHKLIYEIAILHSINGETCDKARNHVIHKYNDSLHKNAVARRQQGRRQQSR